MFWIAYIVLGATVGLVFGYLAGHKQGHMEGVEREREIQRGLASQRGFKAAATRRLRRDDAE